MSITFIKNSVFVTRGKNIFVLGVTHTQGNPTIHFGDLDTEFRLPLQLVFPKHLSAISSDDVPIDFQIEAVLTSYVEQVFGDIVANLLVYDFWVHTND